MYGLEKNQKQNPVFFIIFVFLFQKFMYCLDAHVWPV